MKNNKTIVHLTSEVAPFYKMGGLGDVAYALPKYLSSKYKNVVISIYYKNLMNNFENARSFDFTFNVYNIEFTTKIYYISLNNIEYYFVNLEGVNANTVKFGKNNPYVPNSSPIVYMFFAKASILFINQYYPSVFHLICHDWHPCFIFGYSSLIKKINNHLKTYLIIHNYSHQCEIFNDIFPYIEDEPLTEIEKILKKYGRSTILSLALINSNYVLTVSDGYSNELKQRLIPHEDYRFIRERKKDIIGIVNGVDYDLWSPNKSIYLESKYDSASLQKKLIYKNEFLKSNGSNFKELDTTPLILYMCRLTEQKGLNLLYDSYDTNQHKAISFYENLFKLGIKFAILGTPSNGYNSPVDEAFKFLQNKFKGSFYYDSDYNEEKAHKMLAASDIALIPSLFEPCGLVQLYSMAFGTIPFVRPTGGLIDTVNCFFIGHQQPTGFFIQEFSRNSLYKAIKEVVSIYKFQPNEWKRLQQNCLDQDFSWEKQIQNYFSILKNAECNIN